MSLAFGWTPKEIDKLSLDELRLYLEQDADSAARWLAPDEARAWRRRRRAQRDAWVNETWEAILRGLSTT